MTPREQRIDRSSCHTYTTRMRWPRNAIEGSDRCKHKFYTDVCQRQVAPEHSDVRSHASLPMLELSHRPLLYRVFVQTSKWQALFCLEPYA